MIHATSNTSTLISFYRTSTYYSILKALFRPIIIPSVCWNEMITGDPKIDKKYPDRVRILQDKRNGFLLVEHPTKEEEEMADVFITIAERIFERRRLSIPEAFALSMCINR